LLQNMRQRHLMERSFALRPIHPEVDNPHISRSPDDVARVDPQYNHIRIRAAILY
jgi:hypothetical protein